MADCLHIRCEVFPTCQIDPPADPTPPPVPVLPLDALMELATPLLREAFDDMPPEQAAITALGRRIRAEVARIHAEGRTAAAARILGKITEKQAEIDNPDTDAEVLSTLIDECEGLWMALRAADPETFHREHAAARIAEESDRAE